MSKIKETWHINDDSRERAFLLQFEGDEFDVREKLGLNSLYYYGCPVSDIKRTGLFGILDALVDLKLTNVEIMDFYVHGHVEPYTDPYEFTKGIIEIVYGMSKTEIKNKYKSYLKDDFIARLSNLNKNTQMLISFCYVKDDTYEFIPNKDDLYDRFLDNYDREYRNWDNNINEKDFWKIDGKLFRAVHFFVCLGYDFPKLECLFNEQIKEIEFKQNGKNVFLLNKEYARKMSDDLLSFVCLLKRNNYKFLNPEYLYDSKCDNITLIDPSGKEIIFKCSYLESDVNKYNILLENFNYQNFEIPDLISLCDKRVGNIELKYINDVAIEHSLTVRREVLLSISQEVLKTIKNGYELEFDFPDSDNLFNRDKKNLVLIDPSGTERTVVCEQFSNIISIISLLISSGYRFEDYSTLFDENRPYIIVYDERNLERLLSRKQINKIIRLQEVSDKKNRDLTDSEKDLLFMINNSNIKKKLFEWLPYTAKKWIPSSAVISKIPASQSHEYFYNNNYVRLGMLKDKYQADSYDEMEGLISLGYILGLFDNEKSTSKKAMNYIVEYFLKKGVTPDKLHTTYGAIDLSRGYSKKFADFFMRHYSADSKAFIDSDLGIDMTGELFGRFDEVLESRPEKRIKTRTINKLLTPKDAMSAITDIQVDREMLGERADDERYIRLVELLIKFGASKDELEWAIELYGQALAFDEQKVSIPHIEDLETSLMKFTSHLKKDPQAFLSGRKTNCCSRYGGYAQDRLTHVITDSDWRYITFTSPNKTFFDGLVWYDREDKVVCIDNVEGQFSQIDKNNTSSIAVMADTIIRYADGIYCRMNELDIPCIKVNVGNDPGTASYEIFKYARQQELIYDDCNPCRYPKRNNITTDAAKQFTITDAKILKLRKNINRK